MQVIDFYYFSGTGNTLLVVDRMAKVFQEHGANVTLHRIEDSNPATINHSNIIGLAFPVAGFSTYPFIWDFIKALPDCNGTEVFMVDTLGGFSGGMVGPLKRVLEFKGYKPIGAKEIKMPPNIFYIYNQSKNGEIIKNGLDKAVKYAQELISRKTHWTRIPFLSDAMYLLYKIVIVRMWLSNWNQKYFGFKVDKGKCIKCGLCIQLCPVKNINMNNGFPAHGKRCNFCVRCTSWCPQSAIPCRFNRNGMIYKAPEISAYSFLE
jgi:ferredoxin/flavodoxin